MSASDRPPDVPVAEGIRVQAWGGAGAPRRVLAIRLQAMGDTVLTLPYLQALRRGQPPGATLDFLTREEVAGVPRSISLFDEVFEIGGGRSTRLQYLSVLTLLPALLRRRYDVVLDLQRSRVSRLVRTLLRPPAWCEFERFSAELAGERTRKTIEAIGLGPLDVYPDLELLDPDAGLGALRDAGWDGERDLVVLNPGGFFEDRGWPLESYASFATMWAESADTPPHFVVLGLPSIASKAEVLKARLGGDLLDLVGRTTAGEAFAVLARARLVLSEDSGLMHMAWVAGAPTLGLFGASRAVWASPHGNYSECIDVCEAADGECMVVGHCRRGSPRCLTGLEPEAVVERALALLLRAEQHQKVIYRSTP